VPQLYAGEIIIRDARVYDAKQLVSWWSDGKVMAHASYPKGLDTSLTLTQERLEKQKDRFQKEALWIIELKQTPIGEMHHKIHGDVAKIGIKICETSHRGKGYGPKATILLIEYLFRKLGVTVIELDTHVNNIHAQKMYEKLGFTALGVRRKAFVDQLGQLQDAIDYRLTKDSWENNRG